MHAAQELQEIIKGRSGSMSLLDSFKQTAQKNVAAPLQQVAKKAAPAAAAPASGQPACAGFFCMELSAPAFAQYRVRVP